MAHFQGTIRGSNKTLRVRGSRLSGVRVMVNTANHTLAVHVYDDHGQDCYKISLGPTKGDMLPKVLSGTFEERGERNGDT